MIFTSGGSEANNLAIKGAAVDRLLISAIEHPSVIEAAKASGKPVESVPVDRNGILDLDALDRMLGGGPRALSVVIALAFVLFGVTLLSAVKGGGWRRPHG